MSHGDPCSATELKILGLCWNTESDELHMDMADLMEYVHSLAPTKRSVLKFSALMHHLTQGKGPKSPVNSLLAESLYIDDFVGGAADDNEALEMYNAWQVMRVADLNLRKRNTNSPISCLTL